MHEKVIWSVHPRRSLLLEFVLYSTIVSEKVEQIVNYEEGSV